MTPMNHLLWFPLRPSGSFPHSLLSTSKFFWVSSGVPLKFLWGSSGVWAGRTGSPATEGRARGKFPIPKEAIDCHERWWTPALRQLQRRARKLRGLAEPLLTSALFQGNPMFGRFERGGQGDFFFGAPLLQDTHTHTHMHTRACTQHQRARAHTPCHA